MTERNARPRDDQSREAGQKTERAATIQPSVSHRCVKRVRRRRDTAALPVDSYRIATLRQAGHRIHAGEPVDAGWIACQLWDLADLLEVVGRD